MKKALKVTGKVLLILLIILILFITGLFFYNKIMLKKEEPLRKPLGDMIEVDGHDMCIYTEGQGEHTILFLSGSGTPSPILDFRSLYKLLSDDYRIVVIEKFGYGFSDVVDTERSFDTMLRQDREALEKAGIEGPFVLCPHSMSGIEALLWAQEYPDEVEALIGLDMALPKIYDVLDLKAAERTEKLGNLALKLGLLRIVNIEGMYPAFSTGTLTDEEKEIYRAIMREKTCNVVVINESESIPETCERINNSPKPDIPTLMFSSDGRDTDVESWVEIQRDYAEGLSDAKLIELDCGHYVHNIEYDRISQEIKEFLNGL